VSTNEKGQIFVGLEINSFLFASPLRPTPGIVQNYIGTVACIYLPINNTCNPVLACSRTKYSGRYIKIKKFLCSKSIIKAVAHFFYTGIIEVT
jgi:hypothetical protein